MLRKLKKGKTFKIHDYNWTEVYIYCSITDRLVFYNHFSDITAYSCKYTDNQLKKLLEITTEKL